MSAQPQIAVIVSTYQRPDHLRRSLASLALQRGVDGLFEVVVTDDGSMDHTADVVRRFAGEVNFRVRFTTHEHDGFRLARCRNAGARASTAPYLLYSDGDCIFPPDHLRQHLRARRPHMARSGDCLHLSEAATRRIDEAIIASGVYQRWVSVGERWRLFRRWAKDRFYQATAHRSKPKLTGCNIGLWRSDFERINGFDECFVGWGCEDDDLACRLRRAGVRIATILGYTQVFHMWHPPHHTRPEKWHQGVNVKYLNRTDKPTRCLVGLSSHAMPVSDAVEASGVEAGRSRPASRTAA